LATTTRLMISSDWKVLVVANKTGNGHVRNVQSRRSGVVM